MKQDWKHAVKNVEAYRTAGLTEIYLDGDDLDSLPWEFVTKSLAGGLTRLGVSVSWRFEAQHPCGLKFSWHTDLEPREANGTSFLQLDIAKIRRVMELAGKDITRQCREAIVAAEAKYREQGSEYSNAAGKCYANASELAAMLRTIQA